MKPYATFKIERIFLFNLFILNEETKFREKYKMRQLKTLLTVVRQQ